MSLGVDASFTHQDAAALAAQGVKAIGRYAPPADQGKTITAPELGNLISHSVAVWLVYELSAGRWREGYDAGKTDGFNTRKASREIGWPDNRPIYTGFDQDVGTADHDTAIAYQRGFNDGQANAGAHCQGAAYGDGYVLRILTEQNLIAYKWLSDSTGFTESKTFAASGQASIIQYYGGTLPGLSGVDINDLLVDDFGQHPAPQPTPPAPQRRPRMLYFFTIPDHPTAASRSVVWLCNGPTARALVDMTDYQQQRYIGLLEGFTDQQLTPGTMQWQYAQHITGVS
jgi:hypothetical protein